MKIKVMQTCDERMTESYVIDFVDALYRAAEGKTRASHPTQPVPAGRHYITLAITPTYCTAELVTASGEVFGRWSHVREAFYPVTKKANYNPFILKGGQE